VIDPELATLTAWYAAVAIEPALHDLEISVQTLRLDAAHPNYWATRSAWKKRLAELVGWDCRKTELRSSATFDACFDYLSAVFEGRV
jgi:hypothetical protein